jgi:hypothetical protein
MYDIIMISCSARFQMGASRLAEPAAAAAPSAGSSTAGQPKTVANLSNNTDVFMCILRFHARAGYFQHYETLLKELNAHPASDPVPPDQYEVECASLSD